MDVKRPASHRPILKRPFLFFLPLFFLGFVVVWGPSLIKNRSFNSVDLTPPVVDVWYGDHQVFGANGLPQKWINILGNIKDFESDVDRVSYQLNAGPSIDLRLGPDFRRLAKKGDFNIELDQASLNEGDNRLVIEALNKAGIKAVHELAIQFSRKPMSLPYSIDWSKIRNAQEVLQIVDGNWSWDSNGIRPIEPGYDRVLAVGDMRWTDYEVTVPLIVHGIDKTGYSTKESGGAGFGINLHWLGHSDNPYQCDWPAQPHCGWKPTGASNWYSFRKNKIYTMKIEAEPPNGSTYAPFQMIEFGHLYTFKTRVESRPDGNLYRFKVWESMIEEEPVEWAAERLTNVMDDVEGNLRQGSFLLVAHHVDVTFGNITVTGIEKDSSGR